MRAATIDQLAKQIEGATASIAAQHAIAWPIEPQDSLVDGGFTSIAMVELMLAVEREFDLVIPDRDLIPSNFGCMNSLVALVRRLTKAQRLEDEETSCRN